MPITGHCNCRAISVTLSGTQHETAGLEICHCTDCRRFTGAIAAFLLSTTRADVAITGTPKAYTLTAESGFHITTHFCGTCGSSVYDESDKPGNEEAMSVHAGLFDPGSLPKPSLKLWMRSAEPWETPFPGTKVFQKQ